ncbi:hypothetical protein [Fundicoccus culcitae]|uniref:XkdX family protein n=1 Tax=Fundicoccus culcitae TaxID=2969821 RepID=A0ABY5P6X2_9LACT|nr:hypothetical protein [Fundicoccus culcitae]UUX34125.1 hypothetical protein NRE15_00195 [Fundicoccus culcitae]
MQKKRKKGPNSDMEQLTEEALFDFEYIAGYTFWGFPYGITKEEVETLGLEDETSFTPTDEDFPF